MARPVVLRLAGAALALGLATPAPADEPPTFWNGLFGNILDIAKTYNWRMGMINHGTPIMRECNPNLWVGRSERCPGEVGYQPPPPPVDVGARPAEGADTDEDRDQDEAGDTDADSDADAGSDGDTDSGN